MHKISDKLQASEIRFATEYRGLQHKISNLTGEPQPPCYFCSDQQILDCSNTGRECCSFAQYYSNYEL